MFVSPQHAWAKLEMNGTVRIGIDDLFHGHINASMAGAAKPARPIFDAAVQAGRTR